MKKIIPLMALALIGNVYAAKPKKMYKITVQNLTTGQPLTPAVIAIHSPASKIVKIGSKASKGLGELATDGKTELLLKELAANKSVIRTATGTGVLLPGKTQSIEVEANNPHFKVSIVSMLARTNDAISVLSSASLNLKKGQKYSRLAKVYDAGVELNTETCSDIPAPPCANPGMGQSEDSLIRPHAGLNLIGDLDANRDSFASEVAKITIERMQ